MLQFLCTLILQPGQTKTFNDNMTALQQTIQKLQESLTAATAHSTRSAFELSIANARVRDSETKLSKSQNKVTMMRNCCGCLYSCNHCRSSK